MKGAAAKIIDRASALSHTVISKRFRCLFGVDPEVCATAYNMVITANDSGTDSISVGLCFLNVDAAEYEIVPAKW